MGQEEYLLEAIMWKPMKIPNNQDLIDLIDSKPYGILAVLDSECRAPRATHETFISNLFRSQPFHPRLKEIRSKSIAGQRRKVKFSGFQLRHYAGPIIYNAKDFLAKNNDATHPDTIKVFSSSECPVTQQLLSLATAHHRKKSGSLKSITQGSVFSRQLGSLLKTLKNTTPSF